MDDSKNIRSELKNDSDINNKISADPIDISKAIDENQCVKQYYALEHCLGENDRSWNRCQKEVRDLKLCNDSNKSKRF